MKTDAIVMSKLAQFVLVQGGKIGSKAVAHAPEPDGSESKVAPIPAPELNKLGHYKTTHAHSTT